MDKSSSWASKVIAITGIIGSGKSTVLQMFSDLGAGAIEADQLARQSITKGSSAYLQILDKFGDLIIDKTNNNEIDRAVLAKIIFSDPEVKASVEAIIHPEVRRLAVDFVKNSSKSIIAYEIPLLFETNACKESFLATIAVTGNINLCIKRAAIRLNLTENDVVKRLASQLPQEEKSRRADYTIDNSQDKRKTIERVKTLYEIFIKQL